MGIRKKHECSQFSGGVHISDKNRHLVFPDTSINPDPEVFTIIRMRQIKYNVVVEVEYSNCTNFNGRKIMVYCGISKEMLECKRKLDPHFEEDPNYLSPVARFEPTSNGWRWAIKFAKEIS